MKINALLKDLLDKVVSGRPIRRDINRGGWPPNETAEQNRPTVTAANTATRGRPPRGDINQGGWPPEKNV